MDTLPNFIDGRRVDSAAADSIDCLDPATGRPAFRIPAGDARDVDAAVRSAHAAQPAWGAMPVAERSAVLHRALDEIAAHADELAGIEAAEMGKPVSIGVPFIHGGVATMRDAADEAIDYEFRTQLKADGTGITDVMRTPVGVVGVIVPWNFPLAQTMVSISGALAAGNTVVLKPSEKSSPSAIRFAEVLGLPPGVLNVVLGDRRAGVPLTEHPLVDLVHFTGSVAAGRQVGAATGGRLSRAILELGGKDPVIVDADVDVAATAADIARGAFLNTGQICTSMERIYVHEAVAEELIAELVRLAGEEVMGSPTDPATTMGPLVDQAQREIVDRHVRDAVARGARVLTGGAPHPGPGFFYPPTVVVDVDSSMELMRDETFGPVAPIQVVSSFEEGVELARDSEYGLAMTVYSHAPAHIELAAASVPVGILWVNGWQGGDFERQMEPAGMSGMGATGRTLTLDASTRPTAIHYPSPVAGG